MHAEGWNHYFERLEQARHHRRRRPGRVGLGARGPDPGHRRRCRARRPPAHAAQPHRRGPPEADAVHRLHLPRAGRAPVRLARPARRRWPAPTVANPEQGSLENRISVMAAQAIDAWRAGRPRRHRARSRWRARCPPSFAASILPLELVLHGWDLAQASGQELHISDELVDYLRGLAEDVVPGGRKRVVRPTRSPRPPTPPPSTGSRRSPAAPASPLTVRPTDRPHPRPPPTRKENRHDQVPLHLPRTR